MRLTPEIFEFPARDGVQLAVAVYMPSGLGPFPALFAAAPYRFDNNALPASPQFLWRETGPIDFYVEQGYAYVQLDLRGCGRSGGHFEFLGKNEQTDLFDAIQWIAAQDWSTGSVGSIGQSYFCMVQWFLGALKAPALKCIGAHDGLADIYRAGAFHGGAPCDFFPGYWWYQNRFINQFPAEGPSRIQETDLTNLFMAHPLLDDFWRERSALKSCGEIDIPLFSSGVWGKMQLHTRGNIDGFQRAKGPKKLRMSGVPNAWAAAAEFASVEFHRNVMLPFYDHYLKGVQTSWTSRPPVEYAVRGSNHVRTAQQWPPENVRYETFYLDPARSGAVHSLNDGALSTTPPDSSSTSYAYPDPGWVAGVVGFGPKGPPGGFDPARRVLTFTGPVLQNDLEIAGPLKLTLFASSTATDTDFFVKISDQFPQAGAEFEQGLNPGFEVVTRGWLRASHRAIDEAESTEMTPVHPHDREEPLTPGEITKFEISIEPQAYLFKAGHRVRLEIVNGDSPMTEALWPHYYRPDKVGTDTIHHGPDHPSALTLPITDPT